MIYYRNHRNDVVKILFNDLKRFPNILLGEKTVGCKTIYAVQSYINMYMCTCLYTLKNWKDTPENILMVTSEWKDYVV